MTNALQYHFVNNCSHQQTTENVDKIVKITSDHLAEGPVTLCNFLSNLSRNAVARQVAGELHSVTWVVSQVFCCAKRCTK